ncbi:TIR domain-containing protein [Aeromicrobium yanjiei]|uniref:TIR domain-containing protein n=1 Tax=Aeromicrobium yanjiei TaxID=2662028 RepID=A0A5Q2MMX2_9ACTN|nr:TIR domain-containing protein [Aeromicrobium yanjiei]QGG41310.1 TIR domain-containing protein [Aeromicrobium yanjiei]
MTRRVFISFQHSDLMKAKGLELMTHNKNVNVDFTGRHLLTPVKSEDSNYIGLKIREQIKGSSATIVLIGSKTADSDWVDREIEWTRDAGHGLIGIRIDPQAPIPDSMKEAGAEILEWNTPEDVQQFDSAIERAIGATSRAKNMPLNSTSTCGR